MDTEKHIIYSLIETIRDSEHNNDETLHEELLRNFLYDHRGDSLRKYYKDGQTINDEVFQKQTLSLVKLPNNDFIVKLPKIIRFTNHYGFYFEKYGMVIPVISSENFNLNKRNPFNSKFAYAKTDGNNLVLRLPESLEGLDQASENYIVLKEFLESIYQQELFNYNFPLEATDVVINVDFSAVLYNPTDCPDYDWEIDVFPFPAEKIPELKQQILVKEFGIMNQSKKDEVQNGRADQVRYHDNEEVQ